MKADKMEAKGSKGKIQIGIGIITCILLLMTTVGAEIFSVYTEYSVTSNRELLIKLGHNRDLFIRTTSYWVTRYSFHFYGLISLLLYFVFVLGKKFKVATLSFTLCLVYFLSCAIINITDMTPEQKMRGYTIGGWIAKVVVWLPKYTIELGLLAQGILGVRKYETTKGSIDSVQGDELKCEASAK